MNTQGMRELCNLSYSELDAFLVELVLDIEFENNRPKRFRDLSPINRARTLIFSIAHDGHDLLSALTDTSWETEGWISSTGDVLNEKRFEMPRAPHDSHRNPYSKPLGGLWTSPLRTDGTTSWSRYSHTHSNRRSRDQVFPIPTRSHEKQDTLHINVLADIELVNGTKCAAEPLSADWLNAIESKYRSVRFSWASILQAIAEDNARYRAVSSISVCSTFWLQLPTL